MKHEDLYEVFDARTGLTFDVVAGAQAAAERATARQGVNDYAPARRAYHVFQMGAGSSRRWMGAFDSAGPAESARDMLNMAHDYSTFEVVRNSNYGKL